jgi:hypothetical protein
MIEPSRQAATSKAPIMKARTAKAPATIDSVAGRAAVNR